MYDSLGGKRGIFERYRTFDEVRAVLGERGHVREGGRCARVDSQHIRTVVRWLVGKMGKKFRRRTGASTC